MVIEWTLLAVESFVLSLFAILLTRATMARRNDLNAVQTSHQNPTSRFGGVAVFVTFATALLIRSADDQSETLDIIICLSPIFLVGILEDAGLRLPPYLRLLASVLGCLLAFFHCGSVIPRIGFSQLDFLLDYQWIAIALMVLVVTGITHSFNLLDGLNGLCGFTTITVALSLAAIAAKGGQLTAVELLLIFVACTSGFLILNFPRGLLFLGDAGATGIGFVLAVTAVNLLQSVPELSPWALFLVFFWPITDMLFAIYRRLRRARPAMHPDRMHFHHIVMRTLEIVLLRKKNRRISNPLATLVLLPLIMTPSFVGVAFWNRSDVSLTASIAFMVLFIASIGVILPLAKRRGAILAGSSKGIE